MNITDIKRQAKAIYERSREEEGTLAAYWRGFAEGMLDGARKVQASAQYEEMVNYVKPKGKTGKSK